MAGEPLELVEELLARDDLSEKERMRLTRRKWHILYSKRRAQPKMRLRGGNPDLMRLHADMELLTHRPGADGKTFMPRTYFVCKQCGKKEECQPARVKTRVCCSRECWHAYAKVHGYKHPDGPRTTKKSYRNYTMPTEFRMARALREMKNPNLTPEQAAKLRGQVAKGMAKMIDEANRVVLGNKSWSPTQARVFGILIGKVLPDLSASHVVNERRTAAPEEMSIEELEALVAKSREAADAEFEEINEEPPQLSPPQESPDETQE